LAAIPERLVERALRVVLPRDEHGERTDSSAHERAEDSENRDCALHVWITTWCSAASIRPSEARKDDRPLQHHVGRLPHDHHFGSDALLARLFEVALDALAPFALPLAFDAVEALDLPPAFDASRAGTLAATLDANSLPLLWPFEAAPVPPNQNGFTIFRATSLSVQRVGVQRRASARAERGRMIDRCNTMLGGIFAQLIGHRSADAR
jgi:hypothetical protein